MSEQIQEQEQPKSQELHYFDKLFEVLSIDNFKEIVDIVREVVSVSKLSSKITVGTLLNKSAFDKVLEQVTSLYQKITSVLQEKEISSENLLKYLSLVTVLFLITGIVVGIKNKVSGSSLEDMISSSSSSRQSVSSEQSKVPKNNSKRLDYESDKNSSESSHSCELSHSSESCYESHSSSISSSLTCTDSDTCTSDVRFPRLYGRNKSKSLKAQSKSKPTPKSKSKSKSKSKGSKNVSKNVPAVLLDMLKPIMNLI